MKTILKLLSIFFILFSINLQAENIDECKSDLYFANGIMMKYSDQNASLMWLDEVDDLLVSKPEVYKNIANIRVAYNQSQGFLDDLIESFEQIMSNEWRWKEFTTYFSIFLEEKGIQEDWITHLEDLGKQVGSYRESIKLGHNVIVIAHSQGNYFTNEAYDMLDEWMKPYFHMMGVATPANHVAGGGPYVLFENDFINLVVTGLSPNRTDTRHAGFPSVAAHDFYESYLKESTTRKDIQDFIINQVIAHKDSPSQWETDQEFDRNTCNYKITVKHRWDPSIEMAEKFYPFNASKKLYQANGEWVKASCGGENIYDQWEGQKDNECWLIDNPQKEKIGEESCKDSSLFEVISQTGKNTSSWRITVENTETNETQSGVYPFNLNGSLYQLESGEWVLASCGGKTIIDSWDGQGADEYYMIDNIQEEKIKSTTYVYVCRRYGEARYYGGGWNDHYKNLSCWRSNANDPLIYLIKWNNYFNGETPSIDTMLSYASQYHDAMSFDMTDEYFANEIQEVKNLYGEDAFNAQYDLSYIDKACVGLLVQNRAYCSSYKILYLIFN